MGDTPLCLGFLMFPGFPMACLTSAIEPLRAANEIIGRREFVWKLVAETAAPVRSSADIGFEPDVTLQDLEGVDQLYLLSPPTADFRRPAAQPGAAALAGPDRGHAGGVLWRDLPPGPRGADGGASLFGPLVL